MSQPAATFDEAKLREELLQFINDSKFVICVTVGQDGYPMARTLGYLNDGFNIWLYTVEDSLKGREFRASNKVTLLWRENTPQFFKFLTMKGDLEIFEDTEKVNEIWERYQNKYPMMRGRPMDDLKRIVVRVSPVYLRAEGFGVVPPPILKNF